MSIQLAAFADEADSRLEGQIAAMKENGIFYLEIRGVDGINVADLTAEKAKAIRQRLKEAGIRVWSLGSPFGKISIEEDFAPHLDGFCRGLELARILGTERLRLFSFFIPGGRQPEAYRDTVMERLAAFEEKARGSGIRLCHENEKGIYGDTALRCLEIHQALPEIRGVFDPANFIQCGQDTRQAWEILSPFVEYMHIKDARTDGSIVPAGEGAGQLPYLLSQYKGEVLTLEPHLTVFDGLAGLEREEDRTAIDPFRYPSSRVAFDAAVKALKNLLKQHS